MVKTAGRVKWRGLGCNPLGRHEGGRARPRGRARWDRGGVVSRYAIGVPRSRRASRAWAAQTNRARAGYPERPPFSRSTPRAGNPDCLQTNNATAVPTRLPARACAAPFVPDFCVGEHLTIWDPLRNPIPNDARLRFES